MNTARRICIAALLLLVAWRGAAQVSFSSFLAKFTRDKVPACISYSFEEQVSFRAVWEVDTVPVTEGDSTYMELQDRYLTNDYERDSVKIIREDEKKMFIAIHPAHHWKDDMPMKIYAGRIILEEKRYYGVTVELLFYNDYSELSSEKHFCTISKRGVLISDIVVASFGYAGTAISISGGRAPFYALGEGCIDNDHVISTTGFIENARYKILPGGEITWQE